MFSGFVRVLHVFAHFCARFAGRFLFVFIASGELSLKPAHQLEKLRRYAKNVRFGEVAKRVTFFCPMCAF